MPEIKRPCGIQENFRIPKDIEDLLASIYISYGYIENVLTPIVIILFIPMSLEYRWGFFVSLFELFWLFVFCLLLKRFGKKIDFMFDSLLFAIRIVLPMTHWLGWLEESNRWFFFFLFFLHFDMFLNLCLSQLKTWFCIWHAPYWSGIQAKLKPLIIVMCSRMIEFVFGGAFHATISYFRNSKSMKNFSQQQHDLINVISVFFCRFFFYPRKVYYLCLYIQYIYTI